MDDPVWNATVFTKNRARLLELVKANQLGALAEVAISTSGYCTRLDQIAEETAPPAWRPG